MAKLELHANELVELAFDNGFLPAQISNISISGNIIIVRVNTGIPFPKFIDVSITFLKFQDGILYFKIQSSWLLDKVLRLIPIPEKDFIHFNLPNLDIALQHLVDSKINNLQIVSIQIIDATITVITKKK